MRAGGCTVQQALTAEAASVVKQAVALARRRGHAQVSPLHVANTMLTASTGLLRMACLQSHSHPLQCKALELCFNVALNRLPASTSGPMLGTHSHHQHFPSISNALVAAFKRAQAHQRRGSIENQQQPLLAVKIELEQLILSILDDPSVSRVMREAGFNSTQVKSNVEQAVCLEMCNSQGVSSSTVKCNKESSANVLDQTKPKFLDPIRNEDVMSVIENLMNRRRKGSVIVGECVSTIEGVVKGVMDKFDKGEVPEGLRDVKLMTLSLSSLGHLSIIEQKLKEINSHVNKSSNNRGSVLYLGDLKWIVEQRSSEQLEHMIREIGKLLVCTESGKLWILGIATFQTYMRCKTSYPSLESVWGLHPLTIPSNSLCLSLISSTDSDLGSQSKSSKAENGHNWILVEGEELTCCAECSAKFENEAKILHGSTNSSSCSTTSNLPAWLQQYKNESQTPNSMDQDFVSIKDLCKKWNSICSSKHQHQRRAYSSEKTLTFSSLSASPSTSGFSYDQHGPNLHQSHYNFSVLESKHPWRDYSHVRVNETVHNCPTDHPNFRMYIPPSASNPNSTQNSASSSDLMEIEYVQKFNVYNSDNLTTLCNALERKVPSQKDIIQDIASTILQCRSGMVKRPKDKRETWLLFQGNDVEAKEKIAKELARIIFGGSSWTDNFVSISLSSSFSSTRADSTDHHHQDCRNYKRSRDEQSCGYIERFVEAMSINPHRVFLVEDVEQADYCSQMGFKRAIESGGVISNVRGVEYGLSDAIIILSCKSFISRSRAWSPPIKEGPTLEETSSSHCVSTLDLNVSIEDIDSVEDQSIDEIGLLDFVDRRFVFRIPSW